MRLSALAPAGSSAPGRQNVTVSPDYQSSGILVRETAPLSDAINIYNSFRRPVQVYLDRTSPSPGAVTNFAHDSNVGGHAKKSGDQSAQIYRRPVDPSSTCLHAGHVGKWRIDFKDFLGDDDPFRWIKLTEATGQEGGLP